MTEDDLADLGALSVDTLVDLVVRAWAADGYDAQRMDDEGAIDVVARGGGETEAIAVRRAPVEPAAVADVVVDAYQYGATRTVLATDGAFDDAVVSRAEADDVTLVDGVALRRRLPS